MRRFQKLLLILGLVFSVAATVPHRTPGTEDASIAGLGKGFTSEMAHVNGVDLHYVRGGSGPALILIHGFPQDWYEYHQVMPELATKFTVVAVDLRGVGQSSVPSGGYDAPTMATDVHQLAQQLHLGKVYVVGHDVGGMVAYAYARLNPAETRGAMVLDMVLPGLAPWSVSTDRLWHIGFHQTPDLPEELVSGRQWLYLRYTLPRDAISDADVSRYAQAYGSPARLHAGFGFYRNFPVNAKFDQAHRGRLDVPLVFALGETSLFTKYRSTLVATLRAYGSTDVQCVVIKDSSHYVANTKPQVVIGLIDSNASVSAHR